MKGSGAASTPTELVGYGDRSCAEGFTAISVLLGRIRAWGEVGNEWRATTTKLHVSPFRMSTFVSKEKDNGRRVEVLAALIKIITDSLLLTSTAVVNDGVFALLPGPIHSQPAQSRLTQYRLPPKYLVLATYAFALATKWCQDNDCAGTISCVFEKGSDEEGQADFGDTVERALKTSLPAKYNITGIRFAPKGNVWLEMADMLAWLMTHWVPELYRDPFAEWCVDRLRAAASIGFERKYLDRQALLELGVANTPEVERRLISQYGTFGYKLRS